MPDFNINVKVNPAGAIRGSRRSQRALRTVDVAADRVRRSIGAAFAFAGVSIGVAQLIRYTDTLNNVSNRLKIVTTSTAQAEAIQRALFETANKTRQSYESTAELYNRVALAGKDLNLTHREVLQLTKSVSQAIVISGASGAEASAGLIQFAQGLASGALRGDELRSVLEQLPAVADVIAGHLGITRGELRDMGAEGKITADIIIAAFKGAELELDQKFGKTVPTVSQAITVLNNNFLALIRTFDKGTGSSNSLAQFILKIANSLDSFAISVVTAYDAFVGIGRAAKQAPDIIEKTGDKKEVPWFFKPIEYVRQLGVAIEARQAGADVGEALLEGYVGALGGGEESVAAVKEEFNKSPRLDEVIATLTGLGEARQELLDELIAGAKGGKAGEEGLLGSKLKDITKPLELEPGRSGNPVAIYAEAMAELNQQLEREAYLAGLTNQEAAVQAQLFRILDDLKEKGIQLLPGQLAELETTIRQTEELANQQVQYTRIGEALASLEEAYGSVGKVVDDLLLGSVQALSAGFVEAFRTGSNLTGFFQDLGNGIGRVAGQVAELLLQLYLLRGLKKLGVDLTNPVKRQTGGPLRFGQPAIVGERGPELFVPRQSGNVVPNSALGGAKLTVINVSDPDEAGRQIDSGDDDERYLNFLVRNPRAARAALEL